MSTPQSLSRISQVLAYSILLLILLVGPTLVVYGADTPSTQTATPAGGTVAQPAAGATDATSNTASFVPLTQLPAIQDAASSQTLPNFLNQFYKICIGAGAVLAVLMIMVAGVQFMTSQGSVSSNEKAKARMSNAVLGLILVLSPTIVFSIINPDVLKLDLNFSKLQPGALTHQDTSSVATGSFTGADTYLWEHSGDTSTDAKRCTESNGNISYECQNKDGSARRTVNASSTCNADEVKINICKASGASPSTQSQCTTQYSQIQSFAITSSNSCNASTGSVAVPHGCCVGQPATGFLCCARNTGVTSTIQNTVTDGFLSACAINANDQQKTCIATKVPSIATSANSCVLANAGNNSKIAECSVTAKSQINAAVSSCISGVTAAQLNCMQQKFIPN